MFQQVQWIVRWGIVHREIQGVEASGIDEIAYRLGHKYMKLAYQPEHDYRRLLYAAKGRTEQSLRGFFETIPGSALTGLKFICTDTWRHYLTVIAEKPAGVVNILDRVHVMKKLNEKVD